MNKAVKVFGMLCILFGQLIFSQEENELKNLKKLLNSSSDSMRAEIYGKIFNILDTKDIKTSRLYLDSMRLKIKKRKNSLLMAKILRNEGTYFARLGFYPESKDSLKKSIQILKNLNAKEDLSYSYNNLGITFRNLGILDSAMYYHLKSLEINEKINTDPIMLAKNYTSIGVISSRLNNYNQANTYFLKAANIYKKSNRIYELAGAYNKLGVNNKLNGKFAEAIPYYKIADSLFKKENDIDGLLTVTSNLASIYGEMDSLKISEKYLQEAFVYAKKANSINKMTSILINLGYTQQKRKQYSKAIDNYQKAIKLTEKSKALIHKENLYRNLADVYVELGDYKKAFEYKELSFQVYDSIYNKETANKIKELEKKYETEKKEVKIALQQQEIKTLGEQAKVDKLTKGLYAGGMFTFLAVSGLLFFGFKQRIKKNKIEREKQEAIYKQEIEFKKKELASQTLHLVQKNTFIQELKENLEKIKQSPDLFKIEFKRLVMLLKKESAEDKDWEVFKSYFTEVHNNFDNKLKEIYADISEKEIRLASFLRMNLSTKEIASMLNVLPDSVLKSKYRLKQKLNLDKDTDLNIFLNNL